MSDIPPDIFAKIEPLIDSARNLRHLAEQVKSRMGIVPFVGAGLSVVYGYPAWRKFIIDEAGKCAPAVRVKVEGLLNTGKYEDAAQLLLEKRGDLAFQNAIRDTFDRNGLKDPAPNVTAASFLPRLTSGPAVTTNYDPVLENVFRDAGKQFENVIWGAKADIVARSFREDTKLLVKIHGDAEDNTDRILTRADYDKFYGDPADPDSAKLPLPTLLSHIFLSSRPLLFLGCSLSSDRTMAVLGDTVARFRELEHFAVLEEPKTSDELYERQMVLSNLRINPIWYPHGDHAPVTEILRYIAGLVPAIPKNKVFKVLHKRNPNFTGREGLLSEIESYFADDSHAAKHTSARISPRKHVAIAGLGGVGKTQLADEFCYRHQNHYRIVWTIRAEDAAILESDFADLAKELDLPEGRQSDVPAASRSARNYLEKSGDWLLFFDNAKSVEVISDSLPSGSGDILITTRSQTGNKYARVFPLDTWHREESIDFLKRRLNRDDPEFDGIADDLGDLPLALEQAAAYIDRVGLTGAAYLLRFKEHKLKIFSGNPPEDYHATVVTTWSMAFDEIIKTPLASDLLNLCAFLAPDDIPINLLARWPVAADDTLRDGAIAALRSYSLVSVGGDSISVHRLVQTYARERMSKVGDADWFLASAVEWLYGLYHVNIQREVAAWAQCESLLPHGLAALRYLGNRTDVAPNEASRLADQIAGYLGIRAKFVQAKELREWAIRMGEATFGPNHPQVAVIANNLGLVLRSLGDLPGAKTNFERAIRIGEAAHGFDRTEVAIWVSNLGLVLRDLGDIASARTAYERALKIHELVFGPDHPSVAIDVSNIGGVLRVLGDLSGAKANFERAIEIAEATYGADHPEVAMPINNLGIVLRDLGDLEGARANLERAYYILRQFLGDDHPNTKSVRKNLENLKQN